jgi:hypothetical protein
MVLRAVTGANGPPHDASNAGHGRFPINFLVAGRNDHLTWVLSQLTDWMKDAEKRDAGPRA